MFFVFCMIVSILICVPVLHPHYFNIIESLLAWIFADKLMHHCLSSCQKCTSKTCVSSDWISSLIQVVFPSGLYVDDRQIQALLLKPTMVAVAVYGYIYIATDHSICSCGVLLSLVSFPQIQPSEGAAAQTPLAANTGILARPGAQAGVRDGDGCAGGHGTSGHSCACPPCVRLTLVTVSDKHAQ